MPSTLKGKTIAILATDGFEQSELIEPKQALEDAGARTRSSRPPGKTSQAGIRKIGVKQ
jgi:protease I